MKSQKALSTRIVFFIGLAIGITMVFLIGVIMSRTIGKELTSGSRTFGDIRIVVQKQGDPKGIEIPEGLLVEHAKELWIAKDDIPFLLITQDKAGKVNSLYLCKHPHRPVFWMKPLHSPGKWGNAVYSCVRLTEKPVGDALTDIDFNGRFDFKLTCAADGNGISRFIFVDDSWQKVDHYSAKEMEATIRETRYTFDPNTGCWEMAQ